ncbi:uncharacterized protein LOC134826704 isoform X2 [Bolinopsis microptera]|uniref:uncharacterized protein LOC134826704 isoform X2 n=1 Tax=Bolinopsis microptera TaxID=2820187 RepID=UPI00307A425E
MAQRNSEGSTVSFFYQQESNRMEVEGTTITFDTETLSAVESGKSSFELLGSGFFADVYKYVCPHSNKTVALKHLKKAKLKDCKPIATKFQREMVVHRDLEHKHIVKFFGSIRADNVGKHGSMFLVIQYTEMRSLNYQMTKTNLKRSKILIYIEQILQGLRYLHTYKSNQGQLQPIVHRDLRCDNVLMAADGTLKIADFGLCKRLHEMAEASGIGSQMGNPYWTGPELMDKQRRIGLKASILVLTDIWSLGVLTLELYYYGASKIPFIAGLTQYEYTTEIANGYGPKIPDKAPQEIKVLLKNCFKYEITERATAASLLSKLKTFDSGRVADLEIPYPSSPQNDHSEDPTNSTYSSSTIFDGVPRSNSDLFKTINRTECLTKLCEPKSENYRLRRYTSKGTEELILEDGQNGTYVIKKRENDEEVFKVRFQKNDTVLSLQQNDEELLIIESSDKNSKYLKTSPGGVFAQVNEPKGLKKLKRMFKLSNKRLVVKSVAAHGRELMECMSPKLSRKELPTDTDSLASSNTSDGAFYSVRSHAESVVGSMTAFTTDGKRLDIKKSKNSENFMYLMQYRGKMEPVLAEFNMFLKDCKCDISVTPDSNTALVAIMVAYFYRHKLLTTKKTKWKTKSSSKYRLSNDFS